MTPKYRKRFVLLLVLVTFLAAGQDVRACVCPEGDDSTLGKFESARFVVVNKIISVQKEPRVRIVSSGAEVTPEPFMAIVSIKMIVERVTREYFKRVDCTDAAGRFEMEEIPFASYVVAAVILGPKQFKNCPALLRIRGEISLDRRTENIRVKADRGMDGVELKLPFPSCGGEKIQSQRRVD